MTTTSTYSLISGNLPTGLRLSSTGTIYGTPESVFNKTTSKFVIRKTEGLSIFDQTFTLDVTGSVEPIWLTSEGYLSVGVNNEQYTLNNQWVNFQLSAFPTDAPSGTPIIYYIANNGGRLPPGLTMSRSGKITGFVNDTLTYNSYISDTGGYDDDSYDAYTYDHNPVEPLVVTGAVSPGIPKIYKFKVVATDGLKNTERTFKIMVSSSEILYNNPASMTSAGVTIPTAARFNLQPMQWLISSDLGVIRAANNEDIPVTVYDPATYVGTITYSVITGTSITTILPEGLQLDPTRGYIYGYIPYQPAYTRNYEITIKASKTGTIHFNPNNLNAELPFNLTTTTSITKTFALAIKGEVESAIEWVSTSSLDSIELGITSELAIVAKQLHTDYSIKYSLTGGLLPTGLTLQRDGSISGQVSYFENTGTYSFTVLASDVYELSAIEKTFTLNVTGTTKNPKTIYKTVTTYYTTSTFHSPKDTTKIILLTSSTGVWSVPDDFTSNNSIEVWGGGGAGEVNQGHFGGGGGGYGRITNLQLNTRKQISYTVGEGGIGKFRTSGLGGGTTSFGTFINANGGLTGIFGSFGGGASTGTFINSFSTVTVKVGGIGGLSNTGIYNGGGVGGGSSAGPLSNGNNSENDYGVGGASVNVTGWGTGGFGGRHTFYSNTTTNNDINGSLFGGGGGAGGVGQGQQYVGNGGDGAILISYSYYGTETTTLVASTTTVALENVTYTDNTFTKIYIKPFFTPQQRTEYREFAANTFTFDSKLIYRYFDPNFGVQHDMRVVLEFGIERVNLDEYAIALRENFYRKQFYFGDIKKAIATDNTGSVIYEVIYLDIIDDFVNSSGVGINQSVENNGISYFPAGIGNMRKQLEAIQLQNGERISINEYNEPKFMRSPQAGNYKPPNYIRAAPICYALPGQGDKVISRIKLSGFDFKKLNFEVDRLVVQESTDSTAKYLLLERQSLGDTLASDQYIFGPDWWQYQITQ
jgi:hypothetical protein